MWWGPLAPQLGIVNRYTHQRRSDSESTNQEGDPQITRKEMAPQVGLEPTTLRLTAGCSAIELLRSVFGARRGGGPFLLSIFIISLPGVCGLSNVSGGRGWFW